VSKNGKDSGSLWYHDVIMGTVHTWVELDCNQSGSYGCNSCKKEGQIQRLSFKSRKDMKISITYLVDHLENYLEVLDPLGKEETIRNRIRIGINICLIKKTVKYYTTLMIKNCLYRETYDTDFDLQHVHGTACCTFNIEMASHCFRSSHQITYGYIKIQYDYSTATKLVLTYLSHSYKIYSMYSITFTSVTIIIAK
jgi:hypothetical protein